MLAPVRIDRTQEGASVTSEQRPQPLPRPDGVSRPLWDAARDGRLALQHCSDCGHFNHPSDALCGRRSSGNAVQMQATDVVGRPADAVAGGAGRH